MVTPNQRRTYTCAQCGGTFESGWSEEEALAEADELWGDALDDPVQICDPCFKAMSSWLPITDWLAQRLAQQ